MDTATVLFWIKAGFVFFVLTGLAIVDIARKDFGPLPVKILWSCIALIPFCGWLIYLLFGFRQGKIPGPAQSDQNNN